MSLIFVSPSCTESAVANGDTRTLHFYHTHTGETIDATFRVGGRYDPAVLRQLNHFLRDWRNNDEHEMDPRLFDAVWEAYRTAGATDRIQIYSAYRSPDTNAMLRRRSHAVAEHSQHMLGKAMDTTMPGFPMERIREAGMKLQHGGVGWYPSSNFVHLDVGGVRAWPRMSYDQLARIFPDGKTVHLAADGRTLPGYEEARLQIGEHGGTEVPPPQKSSSFFAWLFNSGNGAGTANEDEEDRRAPARAPVAVASVAPQPVPYDSAPLQGVKLASLETRSGDGKAEALLPLPPPRPTDLIVTADIPLPPVRPDAFGRSQAASGQARPDLLGRMITTTAANAPAIRGTGLPAMITRGGGNPEALAYQALAFASSERSEDIAPRPMPVARPVTLMKPMALRSAQRRRAATAPVRVAALPPATVSDTTVFDTPVDQANLGGPRLMGLRRAARELAKTAL